MAFLILLMLWAHLGVPLIAGLLLFVGVRAIHQQVHPRLPRYSIAISAGICLCILVAVLVCLFLGVSAIVDDSAGVGALMVKMNEALSILKSSLPVWISEKIPSSSSSVIVLFQQWISENAAVLPSVGKKVVTIAFQFVIGAFVGLMAAIHVLNKSIHSHEVSSIHPKVGELFVHLSRFTKCFENVVFAQFYIASVNAVLTGLFLFFGLPLLGYDLPFLKILVAITFLMGLIPIVGNIVSNTTTCLVALSVSPMAAFLCLIFLIVIHKLEYFLNAWIIGSKIKVKSYEILGAMLIFEAVFGLWGLVLAPILYAYIKEEFQIKAAPATALPGPDPSPP